MINTITVKTSRSGHLVPIVDGVALHSTLNPIKEADEIVEKTLSESSLRQNILVLGLGHGYHVNAFLKKISNVHKEYQIFVIEPNQELIKLYNANINHNSHVTILSGDLDDVFANESFVTFLTTKPQIVQHKESFMISSDYFKKFLTYTSKDSIGAYTKYIKDIELREYCSSLEKNKSIDEVSSELLSSKSRKISQQQLKILTVNYLFNLVSHERSSQ